MPTFQDVLADVFDRGAERRIDSSSEERDLISRAQAGDEEATIALFYAYAPALRKAARVYGAAMETDDVRSAATLGFLQAIQAVQPHHDRLAAVVTPYVLGALGDAATETLAVQVPARTMTRFWGVLRRAEESLTDDGAEVTSSSIEARALEIAPSYSLSREAFHAIIRAVRTGTLDDVAEASTTEGGSMKSRVNHERVETAAPLWGSEDGIADAEDRILCEVAFSAVGDLEEDVARAAYGFSSYTPKSDAEIAGDLGLSRPTIQRTRTGALRKMRDRLAVDVEG